MITISTNLTIRQTNINWSRVLTYLYSRSQNKILYTIKKNKVTFLYLIIEMLCFNIVLIIEIFKKKFKLHSCMPKTLHIFFLKKMYFSNGIWLAKPVCCPCTVCPFFLYFSNISSFSSLPLLFILCLLTCSLMYSFANISCNYPWLSGCYAGTGIKIGRTF